MPKPVPQPDVLVLGDHPCAYLAAALLKQTGSLRICHATIPGEKVADRLVMINPEWFDLHPLLGSLKRKLDLTGIYGLTFLADDPSVSSISVGRTIAAYVGSYKQIHAAVVKLAESAQIKSHKPAKVEIERLDETGLYVRMDGTAMHAKLLLLAGELPAEQRRMLGLSPTWDPELMHRYTYVKLKAAKWYESSARPVIPMSLDLNGTLTWAWLLPGRGYIQLCVEQPGNTEQNRSVEELLRHWVKVLVSHGIVKGDAAEVPLQERVTLELPLAGALAQEGVANRTLLIGPAGGFYTACAEDIYPNCWSALHAVDVAKKALREKHVQDALQPYRQRWGATLGDYLRGPQQNLRFLLPLVYRNATMTARLADAILCGKSVVR